MSTIVTVPLNEYLESVYEPECEYIDGELRERNVGEVEHSRQQVLISRYLSNREEQWGIVVLPEQRVQVKAMSYRGPDITVVLGPLPSTPILQEPPFLTKLTIISRSAYRTFGP